jgi:hypothetical protein
MGKGEMGIQCMCGSLRVPQRTLDTSSLRITSKPAPDFDRLSQVKCYDLLHVASSRADARFELAKWPMAVASRLTNNCKNLDFEAKF